MCEDLGRQAGKYAIAHQQVMQKTKSQPIQKKKRRKQAQNLAIDAAKNYFMRYSGSKKPYSQVWKDYSYFDSVIVQFSAPGAPTLKSICVLGTGPGHILKAFKKKFTARLYGCEISAWAFQKIPPALRKNVKLEHMQKYLRDCARKGRHFDLVFSNSLVYLDPAELSDVLESVYKVSSYFHFNCSFLGTACPDPYRKILRSKRWWDTQLRKHGFKPLKNAQGKHTFLWVGSRA